MRLMLIIGVLVLTASVALAQDGLRISMPLLGGMDGVQYVHMVIRGDDYYVDGADLQDWAQGHLSLKAKDSFEESLNKHQGLFPIGAESGVNGFWIGYDTERGVLTIHVLPQALKTQSLSLRYDYEREAKMASVSNVPTAYLNNYVGMDYLHKSEDGTGRQPLRLDTDGAISIGRFVLEGRGDYQEDSHIRDWRRGNVRLVSDVPKDMVRYAAGDLSYPVVGFQSFSSMAGVSLARNFSLQPYLITEPTGQTSFMLTSPSRVEVYVNDMLVRVMQLSPGPYNINDFPVLDGANDIRLVITDASGRTEEKFFPLVSDQQLLKAGLHEYSYNAGIRSYDENREIRYETGKPVFSGFHRYGFSDSLSAGMSVQADGDVQQAGVHVVNAFEWGTVSLDGAVSHAHAPGVDGAVQVGYGYRDVETQRNISVSVDYKGSGFTSLGDENPVNQFAWGVAARYAQPIGRYSVNIGGRYRDGRDQFSNDWSYGFGVSRNLPYNLMANFNFEHRRMNGAGMMMGVSWTPRHTRHRGYAMVDTLNKVQDVRWAWHDGKKLDVGAGIRRDNHTDRGEGHIDYRGNRGQVGIRHDISRRVLPTRKPTFNNNDDIEQRTRLTGAMGIAFAKKYVAISKPIQNGFIMVRRQDNLAGHTVGINPIQSDEGRIFENQIDGLGPAVISDATPYMYRSFVVDVRNLPTDYALDQDQYVAMPSYKSGVLVTIGTTANVHIDGHLQFENGDAVGLRAGIVRPVGHDGVGEQEFFTNGSGRFRISRLEPGAYEMVMHDAPDNVIAFTIPEDTTSGRYDVGVLVMAEDI